MEKPKQIEMPDFEDLRGICQEYIDFVDSEVYHEDSDYRYYIFEAAIMACFGKDAFEWINNRQP